MRHLLLFTLLFSFIRVGYTQSTAFRWREKVGHKYAGVNFSTTRYCGDLSERYNLTHLQLGWGIEGHFRYRLHERWSIAGDCGVYHVRADQRYTQNAANHLSFSTTNFSTNFRAQWDMLPTDKKYNTLYLFAGLGLTTLGPSTEINGTTYSLSTFDTEGIRYAFWVAQLNYGLGFPMVLNSSTQLSVEGRYTHVLSDHLDDVSTNYVDKSGASVLEQQLSDKRIIENLSPNPVGARRGNASKNDGYFLFTLQLVRKFR